MRRDAHRRLVAAVMGAVAVMMAAAVGHSAFGATATRTLDGTVVDDQGKPLADVGVAVIGARPESAMEDYWAIERIGAAVTDAAGRFHLEMTGDKDYPRVLVVAHCHGRAIDAWNGALSELPAELTLTLGEAKSIAGVVVDDQNAPIAGAAVTALLGWSAAGDERYALGHEAIPELMATTDADGRFTIAAMPAHALASLKATAEGKGGVVYPGMHPSLPSGAPEVRIVLQPQATVSGVVRIRNAQRAIAGLTVVAAIEQGGPLLNQRTQTDEQGKFTLTGLPAGAVRLAVLMDDADGAQPGAGAWISEPAPVTLQAGRATTGVFLDLQRAAALEVVVTGKADGKPIAGVQVRGYPSEGGRGFSQTTNDQGIARFTLTADTYNVRVNHPELVAEPQHQAVELTAPPAEGKATPQRVTVQLSERPKITGVVLSRAGEPCPKASIQVMPDNGYGGSSDRSAAIDEQGRFSIPWVSPNWGGDEMTPLLMVTDAASGDGVAVQVQDMSKPLTIRLQLPGQATGRVLDQEGNALSAVQVTLSVQAERWGTTWNGGRPKHEPDGRFTLTNLPVGAGYQVTITATGYGSRNWFLEDERIVAGQTIDLGEVKLAKADQQIAGVVVDEQGKPVAGAQVHFSGEDQPPMRTVLTTDAQGKFVLPGLCPGYVQVNAYLHRPQVQLYGQTFAKAGSADVRIVVSSEGRQSGPSPDPLPQSIQGEPAPDRAALGLTDAAAGASDRAVVRPLLAVFVDVRQRPSRHALQELTALAQRPDLKDVELAIIQMGTTELGLKAVAPVTMIADEKVREVTLTWGVAGLPWYVRVDAKGVATHAGPNPPQ
jgi:uncharacterized GH25 family protein